MKKINQKFIIECEDMNSKDIGDLHSQLRRVISPYRAIMTIMPSPSDNSSSKKDCFYCKGTGKYYNEMMDKYQKCICQTSKSNKS